MASWFVNRSGDFTFILDDGITPVVAVGGAAAAGAAEAAATVVQVATLTLADFDTAGLEVDMLALLRAGAGDTIFALPPRGHAGAILDGEIGVGATDAIITRIRRRNGNTLVINDNDPLSLADYFGAGGEGADLTLYIQTTAGVGSVPVSSADAAGSGFVRLRPLGADLDAIVDAIADGQSFIIAFARAAVTAIAVSGTAAAGAAEAAAHVRQVPALHLRGRADAGGAEAAATVARITPTIRVIRGPVEARAPAAFATVHRVPTLAIRSRVAAGEVEARAQLTRIAHLPVRGLATSGAPAVFAHVARVPPPGKQYARTIRESAPERRLLTALEIRHPAVAAPVRVVNDTEKRTIEGNRYVALRFDARLADDVEGQAPQAELAIDNVGRALTQWLEAAQGGTGATVRVLQVLDIPDPPIEWELTMDMAGVQVDAERVTARLGFDPLLGRAAVTLRHDPQTSPGLF